MNDELIHTRAIFAIISREADAEKIMQLQSEAAQLKKEIKNLKTAFDQAKIKRFSSQLTVYIESELKVKHLEEDRQETSFSLESVLKLKYCVQSAKIVK